VHCGEKVAFTERLRSTRMLFCERCANESQTEQGSWGQFFHFPVATNLLFVATLSNNLFLFLVDHKL